MPTLPRATAQRNIDANPGSVLRDESQRVFKDIDTVNSAIGEINKKWTEARDVMEYTEAKAKHAMALNDIENRAANDPDFKNSDKYKKEIVAAKQSALKLVGNQQVAGRLGYELDVDGQTAGIRIDSRFRKLQLDNNKIAVKSNIDSIMKQRIYAGSEAEKEYCGQQISNIINLNIEAGTLSEAEARKILYDSTKLTYEDIIYSNPQEGLKLIEKSEDLVAEDKYELKSKAQQIIKRDKDFEEWNLQQSLTSATIELSEALHNNTLTSPMVRDMQQKGIIDSETATIFDSLAINKKYDIPSSTPMGKPEYFLRLLESSMGESAKIDKVLKDAAKDYSSGNIGANQYRYFIENAKEMFERQRKGIFTKSKEQENVKAAVEGIKDLDVSSFKEPDKVKGEMVNKFFDRYAQGEDSNKVKNDIINESILKNKPEIANFPTEGKIMVDKNGNKARVFPDGHTEEIK